MGKAPAPAKPRLFFSHSTDEEPDAHKLLTHLVKGLATEYETLFDHTGLTPGSYWRPTLNMWIGTCDAAVVLVTPKAVASEFCQYEWAILTHRQKMQKDVAILPIFRGVKPKMLEGKPHQLSDIGAIREFRNAGDLLRKVKKQLAAMPIEKRSRISNQAVWLTEQLNSVPEDLIDNLLATLGLPMGHWTPLAEKRRDFAVKMLGAGIVQVFPILRDLQPYLEPSKLGGMFELIGCSWVDYRGAQRIAAIGQSRQKPRPSIGLNATQYETADCYVLAASDRPPSTRWKVAKPLSVHGTLYEDLQGSIQSALVELLMPGQDPDVRKLRRLLDFLDQGDEPVFVVVRAEGLGSDWLEKLRADELFASVNFFILAGEVPETEQTKPELEYLEPALARGFEKGFWETYELAKGFFLPVAPAVRAAGR